MKDIHRRLAVPGLLAAWLVLAPSAGAAQEPPQEAPDSLRREVERLRARVDSLQALVERLLAQGREEEAGDALAELREAARRAAAEAGGDTANVQPPPEEEFVGRQRSLQALNPEISVNADVFAQVHDGPGDEPTFVPREFEFSFQASLDPFSRAKIYITRHEGGTELIPFEEEGEHGHEEEGFEIEEGYAEWVSLPGGFGIKAGRFFQQFGQLNRWHEHALPFQSRSLPHIAFIGEEALAQTGVSAHWLLPLEGFGAYETTVEVTRASNDLLFGEADGPVWLGHVNGFWQLGRSVDLDLGVSGVFGEHEEPETGVAFDQRLYGVEGAITWRPPERARYRGFTLRGGVMLHDGEGPRALGTWTMGELRLGQSWMVGARWDRVEDPHDPERTAWLVSPTLTWWQSEWVRLRAEYDHLEGPGDPIRKLMIQLTFAMGPHKHETY